MEYNINDQKMLILREKSTLPISSKKVNTLKFSSNISLNSFISFRSINNSTHSFVAVILIYDV